MKLETKTLLFSATFAAVLAIGAAIQCYQCDSNEDTACPASKPFDRNLNALVDCNSFEARVPGTFCMKVTQQSPGWRGWKKITRRCGSRSDSGVAWGCRWDYEDNGVWKEMCYCEDKDGCNTSSNTTPHNLVFLVLAAFSVIVFARWHH